MLCNGFQRLNFNGIKNIMRRFIALLANEYAQIESSDGKSTVMSIIKRESPFRVILLLF